MKLSLTLLALTFLLPPVSFGKFGQLSSNIEWYGEKYTVTISGELMEQSTIVWDGTNTVPVPLDKAIAKSRSWINEMFPKKKSMFKGATLAFYASDEGSPEGHWAYIINFENGVKDLAQETPYKVWRRDNLTFYVLMDGTLISPKKAEPIN
jgi:hypothetical protein